MTATSSRSIRNGRLTLQCSLAYAGLSSLPRPAHWQYWLLCAKTVITLVSFNVAAAPTLASGCHVPLALATDWSLTRLHGPTLLLAVMLSWIEGDYRDVGTM